MSCVTCHMSHVFCSYKVVKLVVVVSVINGATPSRFQCSSISLGLIPTFTAAGAILQDFSCLRQRHHLLAGTQTLYVIVGAQNSTLIVRALDTTIVGPKNTIVS